MKYTKLVLLIIASTIISYSFSASILKSLDHQNSNAISTSAEAFAAAPTIDKLQFAAFRTPLIVGSLNEVKNNHYVDIKNNVLAEAEAGQPDTGMPKNVTPGVLPKSKY